jgi:hypothetical protein
VYGAKKGFWFILDLADADWAVALVGISTEADTTVAMAASNPPVFMSCRCINIASCEMSFPEKYETIGALPMRD